MAIDWDACAGDNADVSVACVDTVNTGTETMFPAADGDDVIATTAGVDGAGDDVNGSGECEMGNGTDEEDEGEDEWENDVDVDDFDGDDTNVDDADGEEEEGE